MKNSLFKRAIAAAAAVPLALTQCLTYSNAVSTESAVKAVGSTVQADSTAAVTLDSLLYIPKDQLVSQWNYTVSSALTSIGAKTGTIDNADIAPVIDQLVGKLGQYGEMVDGVINEYVLPNGISYEIKSNHDIVISGKVSQPDFHNGYSFEVDEALKELADKYGAPEIEEVDFSSVKIAGDFTITIKASQLDAGTKVPVSFEYKTEDGETCSFGKLPEFLKGKLSEVEKLAYDSVEENIPEEYQDQAKEEFSNKIDKYVKILNKAESYKEKLLGASKTGDYANISGVIADANKWLENNGVSKQLPGTASEIAANASVAAVYDIVLDIIGADKVQITAAEIGAFADSLTNISVDVNAGKGTLIGKFDDAEQEDVKAWVEEQGYEFVDSFKLITAALDYKNVDEINAGSVDVQIERVLVTETTTTTTTSSTTTTTTTTTSSTTSSTSTETTSTSTSTESTTSSTSTETTSTSTSTESTTSSTSTETSTSSTTSSTTSLTTSPEITTSVVTSYVSADTTYAFYMNIEDEFDLSQIKSVTLISNYVEGYTDAEGRVIITYQGEQREDITADVSFATTPSQAYDPENTTFMYDITLCVNGEPLKDFNNELVTATAYIGVKGDVNLDNIADAGDASQALAYYAEVSTNGVDPYEVTLSESELVTAPDSVYEEFAAFLGDVYQLEDAVVPRYNKKGDRLINAVDASNILAYYARRSSSDYDNVSDKDIWAEVLG